jgi:ribosomal protein S18 acetylase RimI-like enzyme
MPPTKVWYLELGDLRPSSAVADIRRAEIPFGPLNRLFYLEIGRDFSWTDRAGWDAAQWQAFAETVETWIVYDRGTIAGYAELQLDGDACDIRTFGLLAPFRGKGLGGALLTAAARRASELAPAVTVNTCELDGPHALANYQARGFVVAREATEERTVADLLH